MTLLFLEKNETIKSNVLFLISPFSYDVNNPAIASYMLCSQQCFLMLITDMYFPKFVGNSIQNYNISFFGHRNKNRKCDQPISLKILPVISHRRKRGRGYFHRYGLITLFKIICPKNWGRWESNKNTGNQWARETAHSMLHVPELVSQIPTLFCVCSY